MKSHDALDGFVFVVTYGRSGSTLLTKLLNTIDGYCIRGENGGVLWQYAAGIRAALNGKATFGEVGAKADHPWAGIHLIEPRTLQNRTRRVFTEEILRPPSEARIAGFKEVRHFARTMTPEDFAWYCDFLLGFPNARIVFNVRDPEATAASAVRSGHGEGTDPAEIEMLNERFAAADERIGERSYLFDYDALISSGDPSGLFGYLNESPDEAVVAAALAERLRH